MSRFVVSFKPSEETNGFVFLWNSCVTGQQLHGDSLYSSVVFWNPLVA